MRQVQLSTISYRTSSKYRLGSFHLRCGGLDEASGYYRFRGFRNNDNANHSGCHYLFATQASYLFHNIPYKFLAGDILRMKALVVISELNSALTLKRCLDSLVEQDTTDDYHIILVDGGSTDGSIEIARSFIPKILLLVSMHISEVGGQNLACSFALGHDYDVILFTNSDCYVGRNWVSRHLAWHKKGYDMVGGKVFWGGDEYGFSWSYMTPPEPTNLLTSGLSLGFSNCSISVDLLKKV